VLRELTDEELRLRHRHRCATCGEPGKRDCYCDDHRTDEPCRERIPCERNMGCPTLENLGKERLTQVMCDEYQRDSQAKL